MEKVFEINRVLDDIKELKKDKMLSKDSRERLELFESLVYKHLVEKRKVKIIEHSEMKIVKIKGGTMKYFHRNRPMKYQSIVFYAFVKEYFQ